MMPYVVLISGVKNSTIDKSVSTTRRFRVQDLRTWKEAREPYYIYHVLAYYQLFYIDATVLLFMRIHEV